MQSEEYLALLDKVVERVPALVEELKRIHIAKSNAYSGPDNPDTWANFRHAQDYGVTPFQGCMVREEDKSQRLKNLLAHPEMDDNGESIVDTMIDRSAYNLIGVILYREEHG